MKFTGDHADHPGNSKMISTVMLANSDRRKTVSTCSQKMGSNFRGGPALG
jgi:hypothetical protein